MRQYLEGLQRILDEGTFHGDRTGTGTISRFGEQLRFDLTDGLPLVTTKFTNFRAIQRELLWFLEGSTNSIRLNEIGSKIWDGWALDDGDLGPIYGKQWTDWDVIDKGEVVTDLEALLELSQDGTRLDELSLNISSILDKIALKPNINQIQQVIEDLRVNPHSRRHLVTAWNPSALPSEYKLTMTNGKVIKAPLTPQGNVAEGKAALPACHTFFQFYSRLMCLEERMNYIPASKVGLYAKIVEFDEVSAQPFLDDTEAMALLDEHDVPKHALSCQMYQRSHNERLLAVMLIEEHSQIAGKSC